MGGAVDRPNGRTVAHSTDMIHPRLDDCENCGSPKVTETLTGMTAIYDCYDCGEFVAELFIGPEP